MYNRVVDKFTKLGTTTRDDLKMLWGTSEAGQCQFSRMPDNYPIVLQNAQQLNFVLLMFSGDVGLIHEMNTLKRKETQLFNIC